MLACAHALIALSLVATSGDGEIVYRGASDASAAVGVGETWIVVADDETNALRVYDARRGGLPVARFELSSFLGVDAKHPEADIEGAARVGDRVYWITSHGRNRDGKPRPARHRLFATRITKSPDGVAVSLIGRPYVDLARPIVDLLGLDAANLARDRQPEMAPKERGLNIEALAASPDGQLLVGLRNPLGPDGRAIVIPLLDPDAVVLQRATPTLGEPLLWDLGGRGIRSLEYSPAHAAFFVVAGDRDDGPGFLLYRWSGKRQDAPIRVRRLDAGRSWEPEALVAFPGSSILLALSDDGSRRVPVSDSAECLEDAYEPGGTCPAKLLRDPQRRTFRGFPIPP